MSIPNSNSLRVAFYIRVSTEEQSRDWFGADSQIRGLEEMINYRAKVSNWVHNDAWVYKDLGCTGANLDRPEYKRMMEDARKWKFDIVAVWKIDRLSRSLSDLLSVLEWLGELKVAFFSLKENMDFTGPMGRFAFQIFWALGEFERETIKMRTKEWKIMSARLGNYVIPTTPFWYVRKKSGQRLGNTLAVNEDEAPYVRRIFQEFNLWKSLESIANGLNKEKLLKAKATSKKSRNTKWTGTNIKIILQNQTYTGVACFNITHEDGSFESIDIRVPTIIPVVAYKLTQNKLVDIAERSKRGGGDHDYFLSRKIIDVETGKKMIGVHRTKWGYSYRRKWFELHGKIYKNREIPWESLENHVWSLIESVIHRPEALFSVYKKQSLSATDHNDLTIERKRLSDMVHNDNNAECTILEDYSYGKVTVEQKDQVLNTISLRRINTQENIERIDKKLNSIVEAQKTSEALKSFWENFNMKLGRLTTEQKQFLIDLLIDRIEITWGIKEAKVHIVVKFDQSKLAKKSSRLHQKNSSRKPQSGVGELEKDVNGGWWGIRTFDPLLVRQVL